MRNWHRIITTVLVAALATAAGVAAAHADRGGNGGPAVRAGVGYSSRGGDWRFSIDVRDGWGRSDCDAAYYYVDPWNGDRYASLADYRAQCRDHWPIAQVINVRSGYCVRTVAWHDGGWHNYDASDPPWRHDRGYQRGWGGNGGEWRGDGWNRSRGDEDNRGDGRNRGNRGHDQGRRGNHDRD